MIDKNIKTILDSIANQVRTKFRIKDSTTRECKESSLFTATLCDRVGIPYVPFNLPSLGMKELEHHFGVTGFKTDVGQVCVLIDLTYIQFTEKTYPVYVRGTMTAKDAPSPGNFISDETKNKLLKDGYIILTENNFYDYFGSFIETNKRVNKMDEEKMYKRIYDEFSSFGINLLSDDYLNKKSKR